ncbi:MAG TPA: ATP-binding protein, partial [Usitatibacter sp.]|nr:ATP-binding protein [Usitatibacter sp.]
GMRAKPGEISLAHQGVLFLDELPEFDPRVLDSLRQPLENGEVAVSRANHRVTYPARFMLVAAMNPCRCGHAYEPGYSCKRAPVDRCTADYQMRISGPLMDRIDLPLSARAAPRSRPCCAWPQAGCGPPASRWTSSTSTGAVASAAWRCPRTHSKEGVIGSTPPPPRRPFP